MSAKTKFIVFDGMDGCGKSTLIEDLVRDQWPKTKEIKFPKTLPSGTLLRINTEKDFELLFSMFELLDSSKTYLLDRFLVSNLVYDKVLRGEITAISEHYRKEFLKRFDVLEIFVTRPELKDDFLDDRIRMTRDQFNAGLQEYTKYGTNYMILNRDFEDAVTPLSARKVVMMKCYHHINA